MVAGARAEVEQANKRTSEQRPLVLPCSFVPLLLWLKEKRVMTRYRMQILALLGGAICVLLVLAASLHDVVLQPGRPFRFDFLIPVLTGGGGTSERFDVPTWLPIVAAVTIVAFIIALIVSPALRRDLMRNLPAYLLMLIGLYFISQAANDRSAPVVRPPAAQPAQGDIPEAPQPIPVPDIVRTPPEWLVLLLTVLLLAGIVGASALLIRRMIRRPAVAQIDLLVDEVREALDDLRAGANLRDTISRCYAEMVRVMSEQRGVRHDATLTPREFEQRLGSIGMSDTHIRRLTRLFERVRYSSHTPGSGEEQEAQACLEAIIVAYETAKR